MNMNEMPQVEGIADGLRAEAKQLLCDFFYNFQIQLDRSKLDRFVDCVIGSALPHTIDSFAQAAQEKKKLEAVGEQNASD